MGYGSFHRHFTIYSRTIARITLKIHNGLLDLHTVNSDKPSIQNIELIFACERIPMGKDNWEIGTLDLD